MQLMVSTADERIVTLDVEQDEQVENVKAILEVETQIPLRNQRLLFNGRNLPNDARLNGCGVKDGDLLMVVEASQERQAADNPLMVNPDGSAANPVALQRHLQNDQNLMQQLKTADSALHHAIMNGPIDRLQDLLKERHRQRQEAERRRQQEIADMNADPFDVEAQRRIEERIQQENIDENMGNAMEHNPEAFGRVVMLYVDMEVNGMPLKAFVDTGAQSTIMSEACAKRCGIMRLVDKRYHGIAKGVGTSKIIGRVHLATIKVGQVFLPCTFTILENQDMEFIFGLDMLRKHQCVIDLKDSSLRFGSSDIAVPFLPEHEIPRYLWDEQTPSDSPKAPLPTPPPGITDAPSTSAGGAGGPVAASPGPLVATSELEGKIQALVDLGFDRAAAQNALLLCNGNQDQAASYLFGGYD
ncbi:DNA damage-inducible protein 1 [Klebsormidium nitens]|uniref:DNA damage-inducible protein 1 n=1 Tax=Klebsormidium nitens TaxID=105231 RepID=A0A0U9HJ99_KLENI|nr:DNA damage-inducible protein 1 [Klebsormidium nitens]|eukprot:GAQ81962.1 DNA damage-inducible protein 1 [Klebsormidium nitens]